MDIANIYNNVYLAHPVVTTDSRHCPKGSMFFALRGERFDGNRYAASAINGGAAVAVVDDSSVAAALGRRALLVDDVLSTLQALAREHRRHFSGPVLQVTGTNGKTTTKELLAAVLGRRFNVLFTQGNLNNHIGVPLTLLRLRPDHDVAVVETGANHPGEIAALASIVQPDYGLITNVGRAHLEGFGSFEGVMRTKGELYDYLAQHADAKAFVNLSDPNLSDMARQRFGSPLPTGTKVMPYVEGHLADGAGAEVAFSWTETHDGSARRHEVQTHLVGTYNVANLRAAATVGMALGVAPADIDAALAAYAPTLGRSELKHTPHNELVVDAYNANPTSMTAALDNFAALRHPHKMVILGDMRELGAASADEHRRIVERVAAAGLEQAWFVGSEFGHALAAMPHDGAAFVALPDVGAAKERIAAMRPEGFLILVKGSNGTRLWELPELL